MTKKKYLEFKEEKETEIFEYQNQIENGKRTIENLKMVVSGAQSPRSPRSPLGESIDERALNLQKELLEKEKKVESFEKVIEEKNSMLGSYMKEIMEYKVVISGLEEHEREMERRQEQADEVRRQSDKMLVDLNHELDVVIGQFEQFKYEKEEEGKMVVRETERLNGRIEELEDRVKEGNQMELEGRREVEDRLEILQNSYD